MENRQRSVSSRDPGRGGGSRKQTGRTEGRREREERYTEELYTEEEYMEEQSMLPGSPLLFSILEAVCLAAIIVFLVTRMTGSRLSSVSFEDMRSAVTQAADMSTMQAADNQMIKRLYGLDPADYDGMCLYYPLTNMGAEELFIVKLKDVSQQAAAAEAIENRLSTQKKSFEGYGIEQSAMLNRSVSEVRGNYAIFISADDTAPMKSAFDKTY